jgi:hypothetical protein
MMLICLCAVLLLAGPGCIKVSVSTTIHEDGSGTFENGTWFTEGAVSAFHKVMEMDPDNEGLQDAKQTQLRVPDEAEKQELARQGLKIHEVRSSFDEKAIGGSLKADFASPNALRLIRSLNPEAEDEYRLTRAEDGVYTFTLVSSSSPDELMGGDEPPGMEDLPGGEPGGEAPDSEETRQAMGAIAALGQLMSEVENLQMHVAFTVPGEIVDYQPRTGATQEEQTVTWDLDFMDIMAIAMEEGMAGALETEPPGDAEGEGLPPEEPAADEGMSFTVSFRLPEGKEIPASALWQPPAPTEEPVTTPPTEDAPEEEPGEDPGADEDF